MKTKAKYRKGLTIIELMIAAVAVAFVILAAGIIIVMGQTSWNRTWRDVGIQREASYALLLMTRSIQAAASAQKSEDNRILYIPRQSDPNITFSFVEDTNNLQCAAGGLTQTVISGKVSNLQFDVADNKVTIDLTLKSDNAQSRFISTVMMRNCGG